MVWVMTSPLLVADATNLSHRAWHASHGGDAASVASMVARWVQQSAERVGAGSFVCAFDGVDAGAARYAMFADYKAGRAPKDDGLREALPRVPRLLANAGVPVVARPLTEADDILAAYAALGDCVLLTSDKDALGLLVLPGVQVLRPMSGGVGAWSLLGQGDLLPTTGVAPDDWELYAALKGDKSDNIPGVPGLQEARAAKIAAALHTVDAFAADVRAGGGLIAQAAGRSVAAKLVGDAGHVLEMLDLSVRLAAVAPVADLPSRAVVEAEMLRLSELRRQRVLASQGSPQGPSQDASQGTAPGHVVRVDSRTPVSEPAAIPSVDALF
jgi:5'-3' exonuclease